VITGRARRSRRGEVAIEDAQVEVFVVDGQAIARPVGSDGAIAVRKAVPQVEDHLANLVRRRARRAFTPHGLDQPGDGRDPVRAEQQDRESALLTGPADMHGLVVDRNLKRPENPEMYVLPRRPACHANDYRQRNQRSRRVLIASISC